MEPISTIALVASFLVPIPLTSEPKWKKDIPLVRSHLMPTELPKYAQVEVEDIDTEIEIIAGVIPPADLKKHLHEEVESYRNPHVNMDGETINTNLEHIAIAAQFIESLPPGIPLPKAMRGSFGEIGFYWDTPEAYADINIDEDGSISLYTRVRGTEQENFADGVSINEINDNWFFTALLPLVRPAALAA